MTSDDVLRVGRPDLSPGIYRGLLKEVVDGDGTGLFGAHAAGATVLNVAAGAFRTAGSCRVDGTVYAYVRDGDTLAIDPPLVAAAEDGEPVESLTPSGETEASLVAVIDLDMDGDPEGDVRAVISGELVGYYPLGDVAAGAMVDVLDTAYGYKVASRPTDAPGLDAVHTYSPELLGSKAANQSISSNTWTRVTGFATLSSDRITYTTAELAVVEVPGMYDIRFGASFAPSGSGSRAIRLHLYDPDGTDLGFSRMVKVSGDAGTVSVETAQYHRLEVGSSVAFEAWQDSGAALAVVGAAVGPPTTDCAVRWVGP